MTDALTTAWIRNPSDERAAANGCRFDVERGLWTVWWIERHCRLYEGEQAGEPMLLRGCAECDHPWSVPPTFDTGLDELRARAEAHNACFHAGHRLDWQFECLMRLFGWVTFSDFWQREVRRFREGLIFIAKKNKKSPTLAAIALYLLAGDGEPGQKVFPAAKDGQQIRDNVGQHVFKMVDASPELSAECTQNKNLMRVTHVPTLSYLQPLSSANERTQQSKEGLNGSVLFDELHVVDRDLAKRVDRAGISRSEPLQLAVSTAGDDPDSYGKERFDHGLAILSGDVIDEQCFVAIHAAPQDLSDADLDDDPLKWGRMANPAFGHTVNPDEFLADYNRSKPKPSSLSEFKKYRLNIWQSGSNPWLSATAWASGKREGLTVEHFAGRACAAGLDLSKTRDMSALVFAFPDEDPESEAVEFLCRYFLPEEQRSRYSDVAWLQPALDAGRLVLTPGDVVDYSWIRKAFRELHEVLDVRELIFDPWHAEETTQQLSEGSTTRDGALLEDGTGVPRTEFRQTLTNFAPACAEFERRVLAGLIRHDCPILTWQAGHVQVKEDANGNKRPVKPKRGDRKTIDGIVAALMAFSGALKVGHDEPWYMPGGLAV